MEISRGRGVQKSNFLKESMALKWNFRRGGGGGFKLQNLPWEGYGYFLEQHNKDQCMLFHSVTCRVSWSEMLIP